MKFENLKDRISYIIGRDMATNFQKQGLEINPDVFLQGLKEAMNGTHSNLTQTEVQEAMLELQQLMQSRQSASHSREDEINQQEGEAFLQENKNFTQRFTIYDFTRRQWQNTGPHR